MHGDRARDQPEEAVGLLATDSAEKRPDTADADSWEFSLDIEPLTHATQSLLQETIAVLRGLSLPGIIHLLARLGFLCLPSYVQSRLRPASTSSIQEKKHRTAFLDGMRGLASVVVFFCHYTYTCHDVFHGFGLQGSHHQLFKLPFFRLLFDGNPMVSIFFVVSGYSLSVKPLKLRRNPAELLHALSSSAFRRAFRLFLPCIASTLFVVLIIRLGIYELTRTIAYNATYLPVREPHPPRLDTTFQQLYDWSWKFLRFFSPWSWDLAWSKNEYDTHLWTIPNEFRASLILFATQLGVLQMRAKFRIPTMIFIMWLCIYKDKSVLFLFFAGFLIADIDHLQLPSASASSASSLPNSVGHGTHGRTPQSARMSAFWLFVFVLGLYFCSQPTWDSEFTPGWIWLCSLIPETFTQKFLFWSCIGAPLIVLSTSRAPFLQQIFDNRFSEYLGKISFALYLVHGTIIHTVGYFTMQIFWDMTGVTPQVMREAGFGLSALFTVPATFWAADVFWRAVDKPSVRFARYIEGVCFER